MLERYHSAGPASMDAANMQAPTEPPPGFVALPLGKGCVCVIPERVYVAGRRLGKMLQMAS